MIGVAPRLRMFAGPNGSGKSLLKTLLPAELLGVYVNPDEIEAFIKLNGYLQLTDFQIEADPGEILAFFKVSAFLRDQGLRAGAEALRFQRQRLRFDGVVVNSYFASVAAAFIRQKLIQSGRSLTLETVMSSPDKVDFLEKAKASGYRTYLYFIATDDPEINLSRIENRVAEGGHAVPAGKVRSRYERSLALLLDAIKWTDRAYLFDNSKEFGDKLWIAEVTGGKDLDLKVHDVPAWFKRAVLDRIGTKEG